MAEDKYPQTYESAGQVDKPAPTGPVSDYGSQAASSIAEASEQMASFVGRLAEAAKASAAVGPAETVAGHTVIPLAVVSVQGGFGMGFGGGGGADQRQTQGGGSGGGAGGGGRGAARVIAIADVSENGVEVRPVPDVTTLALGMMALMGLRILTRAGGGGRPAGRRLLRLLRRPS